MINEEGNEIIRNIKHLRNSRNEYNVVKDEGFLEGCDSEMQDRVVQSENTNIDRNLENVPSTVTTRLNRQEHHNN